MKRKIYKLLSRAKQVMFALALTVFIDTAYSQVTYTLNYTGSVQTLTLVQPGLYEIECWGGNGGDVTAGVPGGGGRGGYSKGTFNALSAGTVLNILVGGKGASASGTGGPAGNGGWNGGGGGGYCGRSGGGGGGATDVRFGGTAAANRIIVAGGGGGAAYYSQMAIGGHGGAQIGLNGDYMTSGNVLTPGGGGAGANGITPGAGGTGYPNTNGNATGGGGGGHSPGGFGQPGIGGGAGGTGGSTASGSTGGSGGGGGGYAGGAGGTQTVNAAVGGGGGSGYIGGVTNGTTIAFGQPGFVNNPAVSGNGMVIIKELCNISISSLTSSSINAICSGNSATITTNAVSNYSWSTGATTSSIVVSPLSTTVYTLGATSASNCTAYSSLTITVNGSVPVLTVANTASASGGICPTKTVVLTASGALSYNWAGGSIPVTNGVVFSPTSAVTYTVNGVNGCGTTSAVTSVSVHPFPTVNPVASSSTLCAGSGLTLTATGNATNYVWSGGSAPGANGAGFVPPASTISYTVIGTSALSCTAFATMPVTVYPTPTIPPTANPALVCIGGSSTLSATGALNYTWTSSTQTVNTADFVVSPALGATTYTIRKGNSTCFDTQMITVVTNPLPVISAIVTPTVVCALTPATLAVAGAQTYTWTASGPPTFTFSGSGPIVSPATSAVYSVTASDGTCISTATVYLATNPNPTISILASASSTCSGAPMTFTAGGGLTYTWTTSGGQTLTSQTQNATHNPTIATAYFVTGDNSFGCTAGTSTVVLVNNSPTITISPNSTLICSGNPIVLTAGGAATYTWGANAGGALTATTLVNPTNSVSGPVTYTLEGTSANNCKGTGTVMVNVYVPTLSISGNTNTCEGGSVTLTGSGIIGTSGYDWNIGTTNILGQTMTTTLTTASIFTLSANSPSAGLTCPATQTVELDIYFNPTITAIPQRTAICRNESVDITANGGVSYLWSNGSTSTVITVSPNGTTANYTVTGTDVNGCVNTGTLQLKISGCVGIAELSNANNGLSIYPNPNEGKFTIEVTTDIQLNLVNELGQLVRVITLSEANNHAVNVNDLAKGIYFISGQKDGVQIYQKIVVTK